VRPALPILAALALASAAQAQPVARPHPYWPSGFRPAAADAEEVEGLILDQTNGLRRSQGLAPLDEDARLTSDARAFAAYLARTGKFSHTADGRTPADRATAAGYDYCHIAENIAYAEDSRGFKSEPLARTLMEGWAASPGHRRNLLDPESQEIGVGVAAAPDTPGKYVAVQEFGRPASLSFEFSVFNRTGRAMTYRLGGRPVQIAPDTIITHTLCAPEALQAGASAPVQPAPGASYVLRTGPGGHTVLERRPAA
jgi:uncharacterized protein YkwD